MSESFEIVVFKQEIGKEDKKRYDLVSTKSFLDGEADLKVKKRDINTFLYIREVLANTDIIPIVGTYSDFNFKSDNVENPQEEPISGIFSLVSVWITPKGTYISAYVTQKKGSLMVCKTVNAPNAIIKKDGTVCLLQKDAIKL